MPMYARHELEEELRREARRRCFALLPRRASAVARRADKQADELTNDLMTACHGAILSATRAHC